MPSKLFAASALLASLIASATVTPAAARHRGHPHHGAAPMAHSGLRHHHVRRQARMLPAEIPYRDPSLDLAPRGQPDFLIHAYLPRFTETPMYNEPPAHFSRW